MKLKEVVIPGLHVLLSRQMPDLRRGSMVDLADPGVEAPHAAEARSQRNLAHGQTGLVDELLRKVQTARLGHRHRGRSQVAQEEAAKMSCSDSQALGKNLDPTVLHPTLANQT